MPTRYVVKQQRARRSFYLTNISVPLSSHISHAREFEARNDAQRALADYLDENVFQRPWLALGWTIDEVNR